MSVFALALIVLFVMTVVASKIPHGNPLKMILSSLSHCVGVTTRLMIVDPIVTHISAFGELVESSPRGA
jgi:hypothetical protein